VDGAGGAFLTLQKAVDVVGGLDVGIFDVTIQVRDGTYTGAITLKNFVGAGRCTILGNVTTPANVLVSVTGSDCVIGNDIQSRWKLQAFKLQQNTNDFIQISMRHSNIELENMNYGLAAANGIQVFGGMGSVIRSNGSYAISGSAGWHLYLDNNSVFYGSGSQTITLTGTPAFAQAFCRVFNGANYRTGTITLSGSATGSRYAVLNGGVIDTAGGGATYLPGNAAGTGTNLGTSPYGLYV
jgi:hypothetical protein